MKTAFWATVAVALAIGCGSSNADPAPGPGNSSSSGGSSGGSSGSGSSSGSSSGGSSSGSSSGGSSSGSSSGSGSGGTTDGGSGSGSGSGGIVASTGVTILVYPNGHHASELIAAINGATTSVYMTMYEIDDSGVINAIVSAKTSRHLDVQVVLDGSTTTRTNNTGAYNSFTTAGINPIWSNPTFNYTHEKCVMIDHKQAWIMTANAESSVPEYNREYLAIDNDAADVTEAEAIFVADTKLQSITPTGDLVVANTNAQGDLVALIGSAKTSLDIEDEEFSDNYSTGVTNAVVAAAGRGVAVRVVVAGGSADAAQTTALANVKKAGASVYVSSIASGGGTSTNPYIHAKSILVDCATGTCTSGFVGSENMTTGSLRYNRELGVIINDATQLAAILAAMNTDFGKATKQ